MLMDTNTDALDAARLFREYGPMVRRRCQQLLSDPDLADDAMQEVFVKVFEQRTRLKDEFPSSLLFRIATNHCLNLIRSRKRRGEVAGSSELLEQIAGSGDLERSAWHKRLLAKLFAGHPDSSRTIAVLHWVDGLTLQEVACEVGLSVSGVRKRLRSLRASLQGLVSLEDL
jgi:RNA polymerase sigma-70 factor (ECF subfamily)